MIGTCHSDMAKPPIVSKQHLNMFYHLKKIGLVNNSPEVRSSLAYIAAELWVECSKITCLSSN